jgi:UDP-glucose 4-epimerase
VREVIDTVQKVHGSPLNVIEEARRAGDPPALIAGANKVREVLGWQPRYDDLEEIARSSLAWERKLLERAR